jgi:CHAD domain-containing protein
MALDANGLAKPFKKVRKRLKNWTAIPAPDDVHRLRTNSRRIEAILGALHWDSRKDRRLLKPLSRVRKRAGNIRDMDVLTSLVIGLHATGEDECILQLVGHLSVARYKQARQMKKLVGKYRQGLRHDLKRTLSRIEEAANGNPDSSAEPRHPASGVAAVALDLSKKLNQPARLNPANLHPYRLQLKQLRYVLEMRSLRDRDSRFIDALRKAQTAIGEWHDWESLKEVASDLLEHNGCALLRQIEAAARSGFDNALSAANSVRDRYAAKGSLRRGSRAAAPKAKIPGRTLATVVRVA